jgi:hypothetical protein
MAAKDVRFSTDARDRMLRGVDILANAVKVKRAALMRDWARFCASRPAESENVVPLHKRKK